ncbi:MAG: C4-type zinc ribbon domain-containing protein [Elusimicrobia bacterium]|nr:C4-type zinc ribbon domain-containing protein [Elusimicrobiota bacterium]
MDLKDKILLLVSLQEKDSQLDKLRAQAIAIPEKISELRQGVEDNRIAAEESKKNLQQLQLQRKQKELDVETKEAEIRKHTNELNSVKANDAYRALLLEIESGKKDKYNLENEILELMEQHELESARLKSGEKDVQQKESDLHSEIARLEADLQALQGRIILMEQERAVFAEPIPEDIMHRYEFVRESRNGLAIVPIEDTHCGACHIELRPQMINEARKHQDWTICDSCSRILFVKNS